MLSVPYVLETFFTFTPAIHLHLHRLTSSAGWLGLWLGWSFDSRFRPSISSAHGLVDGGRINTSEMQR